MPNKKVLIVEDETTLQKALSEYLDGEHFEVLSAIDGEKGLEIARTSFPDIIILDIILPKIDGFQILEKLKKEETTKNIPVIVLTNLESMEDIQKAFERGATTYLVKSNYKLEEITKKINEVLRMKK